MVGQNYYDFNEFSGEETETLLLLISNLIRAKKITDNLPDDFEAEISETNDKIDDIIELIAEGVDGGEY